MSEITVDMHNVTVDRGKEIITLLAAAHEIEVLRVVHGQKEVVDLGVADGEEVEMDSSAFAEIDRLTRVYARNGSKDPVRFAFPQGPSDLRKHKFEMSGMTRDEAPMSGSRKHPKPEKPKKAAEKPEK